MSRNCVFKVTAARDLCTPTHCSMALLCLSVFVDELEREIDGSIQETVILG
jgi:hypothetical protein